MSQQDPFYNNYTGASTANNQVRLRTSSDTPTQHLTMITQINEQSLQAIRAIVREEVQKAIVEMVNKIRMQSGAKF